MGWIRAPLLLSVWLHVGLCMSGHCPEGEPANPQDVRAKGQDVSIFSDLTVEEMDGVLDYMYNESGITIAGWSVGTINDTYLYTLEALPPKKSEALAYLDENSKKPERYAKVILYRGDANPPDIQELKVGPLPKPSDHTVIKNPHYKDPIPYHNRNPVADHEMGVMVDYLYGQIGRLESILTAATGGYTFSTDCGEKCLIWFPGFPGRWQSGTHMMFVNFFKNLDSYYLHPVGLQVRLDTGSLVLSDWHINFVWWRGKSYESIEALLEAHAEDKVDVTAVNDPEDAKERTLYSSLNFRGDPQPEKPQRGPRSYYPDGRRYKVNGHHVSWQGWEFNFGVRSIQGLHVDDIRFHGDRVVYELSMQEIGAFYSGGSPQTSHTSYYDTIVFIGREIYELQPGIDCPEHATFFDFVHYFLGKAFVFKNSVCVFEQDMGVPLRRHYETDHAGDFTYVQGMNDNALVVRSMVVAYNYEYMHDVIFHQQGGIENKFTLSGYILSSFFTEDSDTNRGFEVSPNAQGNIHHHLTQFKVDMDIHGTSNRFETYDISQKKFEDEVDVGEFIYGNMFTRNLRETESEGRLKPGPNQHLIFFNDKHENAYGNKKGYRLQLVHGSNILYPEDWKMSRAGACFKYPVVVTKHSDHEHRSSLHYATVDPFDPVMSFEDFYMDNDTIVDEDLVTWVTVGTIHIPHTEDIPIVTTQNTQLTFHLTPYNYFPEDPSLASRDNVRVERQAVTEGSSQYSYRTLYAGVAADVTCVPPHVKLPPPTKEAEATCGATSAQPLSALLLLLGVLKLVL